VIPRGTTRFVGEGTLGWSDTRRAIVSWFLLVGLFTALYVWMTRTP
jgi:hypothetical protein